jgi:metallo-beta-lactamase family protein
VIISSSGMLEGGRILHHLRNRISDQRNTILMTSWQAPNTLGRQLVENARTVRIFGEEFKVNARIESLDGFSGHADRDGLIQFARAMQKKPQLTFIVHGEKDSSESLANGLRDELAFENVCIPEPLQSFEA